MEINSTKNVFPWSRSKQCWPIWGLKRIQNLVEFKIFYLRWIFGVKERYSICKFHTYLHSLCSQVVDNADNRFGVVVDYVDATMTIFKGFSLTFKEQLGCLPVHPIPACLPTWLSACPTLSSRWAVWLTFPALPFCWPAFMPGCLPAHICLSAGLSTYLTVCLPIPVSLLACLPTWLSACPYQCFCWHAFQPGCPFLPARLLNMTVGYVGVGVGGRMLHLEIIRGLRRGVRPRGQDRYLPTASHSIP